MIKSDPIDFRGHLINANLNTVILQFYIVHFIIDLYYKKMFLSTQMFFKSKVIT